MKQKISLMIMFLLLTATAVAQKDSRDLYMEKAQPGAKLTLILKRDGKTRRVPLNTVFQSGDRVAFQFETNFAAYVAVMTKGSSGKRKLLFPYSGAKDRINPNETFRIPTGENWFVFDNTPGREELVFVMSSKPIAEVGSLYQSLQLSNSGKPPANTATTKPPANTQPAKPPTNTQPAKPPVTTQPAKPPAMTEEQEILAALNSRALQNGRDLYLDDKAEEAYVTTSQKALSEPIAIPLYLKHK